MSGHYCASVGQQTVMVADILLFFAAAAVVLLLLLLLGATPCVQGLPPWR
jgi:hypothetical protein